jgi:ribose transport system substrate-binding protein
MKKYSGIALVLVIVMVAVVFGGCASNAPAAEAPPAEESVAAEAPSAEESVAAEAPPAEESEAAEGAAADGDSFTLGMVLIDAGIPYCQNGAAGFTGYVESQGGTAIVLDAAGDRQKMLDCMDSLITQGVDGIVIQSVDNESAIPISKEAMDAGIIVAASDEGLATEEGAGVVISQTISNNYAMGVMVAEDMLERSNGEPMNVVTVSAPQNSSGVKRIDGFIETIAEYENFTLIAEVELEGYDREEAMQKIDDLLTAYDDIDGIFCYADSPAIPTVNSVKSNNRLIKEDGTQVLIYGTNGDADAVAAVKAGDMTGTVQHQPALIAETAAADIYTVLRGGQLDHPFVVEIPPGVLIDASIADEFL